MKKITLFFTLIFITTILPAQDLTTGVISDPFSNGRTVRFDINTSTNVVTMTMVFPENKWFGIALANDGIQGGQTMADADDDVILGVNTGIEDRNMTGMLKEPPLDTSNDWAVVSNTVDTGIRTIVATRDRDTGDIEDFVFPNTAGLLPMLYAQGSSSTISYHDEGKGFLAVDLVEQTLSTSGVEFTSISLYPNPVSSILKINAPTQLLDDLNIEVYNVLGEKVFSKSLNRLDTNISVSGLSNGVYLMKISSAKNNQSIIKRFVKI